MLVEKTKLDYAIFEKHSGPIEFENSEKYPEMTVLKSTFIEAMDWFKNEKETESYKYSMSGENHSKLDEFFDEDYDSWRGGSYSDLFKTPKMNRFNQIKKELRKSDLYKKLDTYFHKNNVRKRSSSPHDGEYDHDKKWDINPFTSATRGVSPVRAIKIYIHLSFNCGVSSDEINEYGATVAAISNLLESYGISVEIIMRSGGEGSVSGNYNLFLDEIHIKKPGDYLPASSLLKIFNSNFMRRVEFFRIVMNAEIQNKEVSYGLGCPQGFKESIHYKKGEIHIHSTEAVKNGGNKSFLDGLTSALGIKEK